VPGSQPCTVTGNQHRDTWVASPKAMPLPRRHVVGEAKGLLEEPYGLMRPRTDLWEPWAGNRPGPPGQRPKLGSMDNVLANKVRILPIFGGWHLSFSSQKGGDGSLLPASHGPHHQAAALAWVHAEWTWPSSPA